MVVYKFSVQVVFWI